MSSQSPFYGPHTERKLQAIENYLVAFLQALSKRQFKTVYIDAFAGSGTIPGVAQENLFDGPDSQEIALGSALRAIRLQRKFDKYIFIEKDSRKMAELRAATEGEGLARSQVEFIHGTAEDGLARQTTMLSQSNVRSVVFLDPFGSQVGWSTLEALGRTRHVDLWYLFPAGLSVYRQISSDGKMTHEQERSLDRLFGPHDWRKSFLKTVRQHDLFGEFEQTQKSTSIDDITRFMIQCLSTVFAGGARPEWLPLGRDGGHWYSLIFAMANPSESAKKIGHEVAKHILTAR